MKKEKTEPKPPRPIGAGRLNRAFFGRTLWVLICVDLVLALMLYGWVFYRAEETAAAFWNRSQEAFESGELIVTLSAPEGYALTGTAISLASSIQPGVNIPGFLQGWTPMGDKRPARRLTDPAGGGAASARLQALRYELSWLDGTRAYALTVPIGNDLYALRVFWIVLGVLELLLLLGGIGKGRRAIRRQMRFLYAMLDEARALSERASGQTLRVGDMAGALGGIDDKRLDRRISLADTPEELHPLAEAINAMLDRISAAYDAQVRFVSDASHELRTPITVIQGYANLLDRWGKEDMDALQESIEAIKAEAQGMQELVEQLLFLARGDNDSIRLDLTPVDVGALMEETARELRLVHKEHPIEARCPEHIYTRADRALMKQLLRIFADNGVKYSVPGNPVVFRAVAQNGLVTVSVTDNGQGIAEADLPRVFDRFYRSEEARARKKGGAGLGLSIAQWIIRRHGWRVEVVSRAGIGTRFSVYMQDCERTET